MKLSKRDYELINLALDILDSDYDDSGKKGLSIQRQIVKLKIKLAKMEAEIL